MSRKPQPGSCGRCGRAVVKPIQEEVAAAININHWGLVWVRGHRYDEGVLKMVRCPDHEREERRDDWDDFGAW